MKEDPMTIKGEIVYFDRPGPENTDEVMAVVRGRVAGGDIQHVAVATTSGRTALRAAEIIDSPGAHICAIAFQSDYWPEYGKPDEQSTKKAESLGVRFIPDKPKVAYWHEVDGESADTLRKFGQGIKVAVEVIMMAVEAGLIPAGAKAIGVGGSSRGADAAVVASASGPDNLGEFFVHEILAKPIAKK
jgi:hypothetical protein